MSQSTLAATRPNPFGRATGPTVLDTEAELTGVLGALEDADCRAILEATTDEAHSASELAEACELALSTTYRKLDQLSEAGLLEEGLRIRRSGKHTSEYSARIDEFTVTVTASDGVQVTLTEAESDDPLTSF
ncbi:winged helix-turn-helix domain-containing protein [Halovivax gelatinilyticus]|uniref:winged helix-turn-helix domain-containing protein n=1 Tax=Halovivax gelatinilyticus TaxID=2961597 RepID=UPI0020CA50CB|nr:helix-turn-helix domain-containing protein [Halovivax gelatinilyticus]